MDFSIGIIDHSLSWGTGAEQIQRLSKLCNLDFALVSTQKDSIFVQENIKDPKISGLFGKYEFDEMDSWIRWIEEKRRILRTSMG